MKPAGFPKIGGFTLVEMLVSVTVLALLMVIIAGVTSATSLTVRTASAEIAASQSGRSGFDIVTQKLSQATLNTYWDYDSATAPTKYVRKSDLHFVVTPSSTGSGQAVYFQAPAAFSENIAYGDTQGLLNACGYFVQFGNDDGYRPPVVTTRRWRYRLMQGMQATENLTVFTDSTSSWTSSVNSVAWPIADNVIALIVWPRETLSDDATGTVVTSNYKYDSRAGTAIQLAQLAPVVQVTIVMIDEASAKRLDSGATPPSVIQTALAACPFTDVTKYTQDLANLQAKLGQAHINSRTLTSSVTMRESKWSSTP